MSAIFVARSFNKNGGVEFNRWTEPQDALGVIVVIVACQHTGKNRQFAPVVQKPIQQFWEMQSVGLQLAGPYWLAENPRLRREFSGRHAWVAHRRQRAVKSGAWGRSPCAFFEPKTVPKRGRNRSKFRQPRTILDGARQVSSRGCLSLLLLSEKGSTFGILTSETGSTF